MYPALGRGPPPRTDTPARYILMGNLLTDDLLHLQSLIVVVSKGGGMRRFLVDSNALIYPLFSLLLINEVINFE